MASKHRKRYLIISRRILRLQTIERSWLKFSSRLTTKITKATNFQTAVQPVSLRATDQIHFDIEDRLLLYKLFYDRKKGRYRYLRKPIDRIISIRALAQSMIAVVLQRPNDSRARPQSVLNNERQYKQVFDDSYNRDVFVACTLIDRAVDDCLAKDPSLTREERRDIRYYVDMCVGCYMAKRSHRTVSEVAALTTELSSAIPAPLLGRAVGLVLEAYKKLGATDTMAKGTELCKVLLERMEEDFPVEPEGSGGM